MIKIRTEPKRDISAIYDINFQAFGQAAEAILIDQLHQKNAIILSLVAEEKKEIVRHILFSPVHVHSGENIYERVGLGPMAVLPECQRTGIGSLLVEKGLVLLRERGCGFVVVLGHPEYYPRFGFVPGSRFDLTYEYDVPDELFMALELQKGVLQKIFDLVKYQPEFNEVE